MNAKNSGKVPSLMSFATMDRSPTEKAPFGALLRRASFCKRSNNVVENREVGMYVAVKVREN